LSSFIVENVGNYREKHGRKGPDNSLSEVQCWQNAIYVDITFRYSYFSTCRIIWIYQARHRIRGCKNGVFHINTSFIMINIFKYRIRISLLDASFLQDKKQKRQKYRGFHKA
jgi:hypothetical protein